MAKQITYCRNCASNCGLILDVEDGKILSVVNDKENIVSEGYACIKGKMAADLHNGEENRLMQCMKRGEDGKYYPIDKYQAIDEIAEKLQDILQRRGPRALGAFFGTTSYSDSVGKPFIKSLLHALGAPSIFTTMTVDQSSKWVTAARMGVWANGKPVYTETDVVLIAGCNPLVSHQGYPMTPFPATNVVGHIREGKARGIKIIVIDPRYTEMARLADLFIQPKPGYDAAIFAALIREVLAQGWGDLAFAQRWTVNFETLREAVEPFTLDRVAAAAGVPVEQLAQAARWLGEAKKPGIGTGTGVDMAAFSNTTEHLVEALTGLVGAYIRAGEKIPNPGVFMQRPDVEMVIPPDRSWERPPFCASDKTFGKLMGEFPASIFPDEILNGGDESIRALLVSGANPAMALGEPDRVNAALDALELLVTFDPRLDSGTAQKAHYVMAPTLQFERAEVTTFTEMVFHFPFIQYAAQAKVAPPQTIGEDEFVWRLAKKLGVQLTLKNLPFGVDFGSVPGGLAIDMESDTPPNRDELLAWLVNQTPVSFDVLKAHPHGYSPDLGEKILGEAPEDSGARLDLCPSDVREEIGAVAAALEQPASMPFMMTVRRIRESFNSSFQQHSTTVKRHGTNRLYMHPDDAARLGGADDSAMRLWSAHGEVIAYLKADATMRPGSVSLNHCWGSPANQPDPWFLRGAHTGRLISLQIGLQSINRMPLQSGVPVAIERLDFTLEEAQARAAS
jgi:anaerobic selenocysteine-containing dehydrogenase